MPTLTELQESRAGLFGEMKAILDSAESAGRDLTAEERQKYDRMESELDDLGGQIDQKNADAKRRKKIESLEAEMSQSRNRFRKPPVVDPKGGDGAELIRDISDHLQRSMSLGADRREALRELVKTYNGHEEMAAVRQAVRQFITTGLVDPSLRDRAGLQMDSDTGGGTLVMPEDFVARLIIGLDERVFMRQIATVLPLTSAESVGVPSLENDPADADWTAELAIGGTDTTMSTGKRNLHPHPTGKLLKVSKTLLRRSAIPVETLVRQRLEFKFAVTEEKGFLTGTGQNQPLGVFTASSDGIGTGQDVSTDNTTTDVTADGLINAKYTLASQYHSSPSLRWVFHRTAVRNIRKLKDGNGQYLWSAGLGGQPDTILDTPYEMSEYAPSTFTTGLYVGIIGDFMWYWIAESLRFELQRLDELYAATNEVGFIGRLEADGMPVLAEAFVRVKLA